MAPKLHRTVPFKSLAWLIGAPLKIIEGVEFQDEEHPDGEVMITGDYPRTIMLDMTWKRSKWGADIPPRTIRTMIPKASIACGAVKLATTDGMTITQNMVSDLTTALCVPQKERDL